MKAKTLNLSRFSHVNKAILSVEFLSSKSLIRTQITNLRSERGDTTIDSTKIKRMIRYIYEQLYVNKFDNLMKWMHFLKDTNCQILFMKKIDNLRRVLSIKIFEFVVKIPPTHSHKENVGSSRITLVRASLCC